MLKRNLSIAVLCLGAIAVASQAGCQTARNRNYGGQNSQQAMAPGRITPVPESGELRSVPPATDDGLRAPGPYGVEPLPPRTKFPPAPNDTDGLESSVRNSKAARPVGFQTWNPFKRTAN